MTHDRVCEILAAKVYDVTVTDDWNEMSAGLWYEYFIKPGWLRRSGYEDIRAYIKVKDGKPVGVTRVENTINRGIEFNVFMDLEDREGEREFDCLIRPVAKITDENELAKILLKVEMRYIEPDAPYILKSIYARDLVDAIEVVEKACKDIFGSAEDLHTERFRETEDWKKVLKARKGKKK